MNKYGSTSRSLLDGIRARDQDSWDRFVDLYSPLICYWCQREGVLSEEIDEVAQDVYLSIYSSIHKFKASGETGSFRSWIGTITRRRVVDYFRANGKCPGAARGGSSAMQFISQAPALEFDISDEKRLLVARALQIVEAEFSESHQRTFRLLVLEQWKAKDVAKEMGITPNAVYMVRHHVLKRLRAEFDQVLD